MALGNTVSNTNKRTLNTFMNIAVSFYTRQLLTFQPSGLWYWATRRYARIQGNNVNNNSLLQNWSQ